jgi:hypothetical protein
MDDRELERRLDRLEDKLRGLEYDGDRRDQQIKELWNALQEHRRAHAES